MSNPSDQESGGWLENRGFGALDWASKKHSVVVVDPKGKVLEDFEIDHSALGWKKFRERRLGSDVGLDVYSASQRPSF